MASQSASSKKSKGSSTSNNSMHSEAKKTDSHYVEQEHLLTSRMLSFTNHEYHSRQLNLNPNNHYVVLEPKGYPEEAVPLLQILKNHILTKALTLKRTDIPETYIQQFWLSAKHEKQDRYGYWVMGYATHPSTTQILDLGIKRRRVAEVFELPTKTQLNLLKYSDEPSDDEIVEFLRFIGYAAPISKRTDFRRQNLPSLWNILFSILNRFLTCKVGSPDQSSHTILAVMYGMYYDLPLDYATLIFREIRNAVIAKKQDQARGTEPKNLVFNRFFALLLGDALIGERKLPVEGEGAKVRTEEGEETEVQTEAVVEKREKKHKKKRTPKKRVAEEETPKSPTEVVKPKKKAKKLTKEATSELVPSLDVNEPEESEQPLQRRRRKVVIESSEEKSPSPLHVAMDIAMEIQQQHFVGLGETANIEVQDVTGLSSSEDEGENNLEKEIGGKDAIGTQPNPTTNATHISTPAVLVQRGIETGPHSPNQTPADRTEDIPSSSVPPFGETKPTSPSQKGESVSLHVHSPQDTSPPHTEVFVTSITHKSDTQTTSELVVKKHDDYVGLEQPQDPFNIDLKRVSEPSIDASSVEHRGLEGNLSELNIPTGSTGAKDSLCSHGAHKT
ncbi:hypothetical protein L6452_19233 [Arctium lappa]|uniref:Uncharacterized protein n=1 Tax=Arctium lappa TaxID=4217 RepID=A0ACB9B989_ARCLA|nr:hypothetical protein L6452_19233 [Arctium lappa]